MVAKHRRLAVTMAVAIYMLPCPSAGSVAVPGTSRPQVSRARINEEPASAVGLSWAHNRSHRLSPRTLVGNIVNPGLYQGCGCRFQLPAEKRARSNRYFFIADQLERAWMNIEGEDCQLRLIGAEHMSLKSRKGQRAFFRFGATGVEVRVSMLVTRTSTYEIDYEPARYAITIQVVKGNHRQTVRTIGSCGC